ncbi:insoluble domain protein [Rhodococcus opacus]|uniref:Insoluble domain protein n=1 Tax=Rhodococcus opacus TaxID=37919 RepID=A0AAX3YS40_RHOOP|nr:insoluble domain protein [Rhodococcus opacus]MCZ4587705.1 insoluble domain protein [Rhodococcus opacus]WLF51299.1 insoluble domain protein [Rhodococcus opacus]
MAKKHRKPRKPWLAPTAVAAGIGMTAVTGAGIANAAPETGWSNPNPSDSAPESGWSNPTPTPAAPEPAPVQSAPEPEESFWVAPPPQYNQGTRAYDPETGGGVTQTVWSGDNDYSGGTDYSGDGAGAPAQVDWSKLHAPSPVLDPTLPIEAPKEKIRIGRVIFDQPNWVSDIDANRTNNTTAVIEAQVTDGWRSVGLETSEAERIASAQTAGTALGMAAGGAVGCAAGAVPASMLAGTVGGIGGALAGGFVPLPVPGAAPLTTGVVGTAGGAAIGAAAGCAVGGGLGALGGGAAGFAAGTVYGAGENATPIEAAVPDVEQDQIVEQVDTNFDQWSQDPVGEVVVDAVQTFTTETAPALDTQTRDFVEAQPGGEQIIGQVDQTLETFFNDATPGLSGNLISTTIGDAIAGFGAAPAPDQVAAPVAG